MNVVIVFYWVFFVLQLCMDHFTILVGLIGVVMFTPFCINGQAPTRETVATKCTPPAKSSCYRFCGALLMQAWKTTCGIIQRKRSSTGIV